MNSKYPEDRVEFLIQVLSVQSKSKDERKMKRFVRRRIRSLGLDFETDEKGNMYCHKGDRRKNRPFVVAHLDTVHKVNKNVQVLRHEDALYAFDFMNLKQAGVGGDDKVGVWAALMALKEFDNISVAFFVEEEIGCVGSNAADLNQFKKANWIAQLDRRENEDFIVSDMASEDFISDMTPIAESHDMKTTTKGTVTDVYTLCKRGVNVSGVNIASGYYRPHMDDEVVFISDAENSLEMLFKMITEYGEKKYPHVVPKKVYTTPSSSGAVYTGGYKTYKERKSKYNPSVYAHEATRIWDRELDCYKVYDPYYDQVYYELKDGSIVWERDYDDALAEKAYQEAYKELPRANYHEYEADYETSKIKQQLDSVLFMFGFTHEEFIYGQITSDFVKNISTQLFYETGKALKYYEKIFNIEGMYLDSDYIGNYVNCKSERTPF